MKESKEKTWRELKDFVNKLSDEQLDKVVRIWGDEKGFTIMAMHTLEEDYFNPSGEGMEPVSMYEDPEDWEQVKDEPILLTEGTPILTIYE